MQHDTSSWIIEDAHFVRVDSFSTKSDRIARTMNSTLARYDFEIKKEFVDTLFGIIERLDIKEFSSKEKNLAILKESVTKLPDIWKKTPKEDRKVLSKVLFTIVLDYIKEK